MSIRTGKKGAESSNSPSEVIEELARAALDVAKKARRHHQNLTGDNFYGNKLATLRADATNAFRALSSASVGESSALAELVESVFAATTDVKRRTAAFQELVHSLRTTWRSASVPSEDDGVFPLSLLSRTGRGYLSTIGRQMNGCYTSGWFDAASTMMRRLLEAAIIEAFEARGVAGNIKNKNGDYFQLTDLIAKTVAEPGWSLSRNTKRALPRLRDLGHMSSHGRHFTAQKEDVNNVKQDFRVALEELLRHAGLL
ncbi:MAG: hypothetical protein ABIR71_11695 [Chthoniobacterales bacterium]